MILARSHVDRLARINRCPKSRSIDDQRKGNYIRLIGKYSSASQPSDYRSLKYVKATFLFIYNAVHVHGHAQGVSKATLASGSSTTFLVFPTCGIKQFLLFKNKCSSRSVERRTIRLRCFSFSFVCCYICTLIRELALPMCVSISNTREQCVLIETRLLGHSVHTKTAHSNECCEMSLKWSEVHGTYTL